MAVKTFYPPEIYRFLLDIAHKHDLAIKEVETVFLRHKARELGFECFHEKIGFARRDGKPFCKGCWARLEQVKPTVYGYNRKVIDPGKFRPIRTFLDDLQEEPKEKVNVRTTSTLTKGVKSFTPLTHAAAKAEHEHEHKYKGLRVTTMNTPEEDMAEEVTRAYEKTL